MSLASHKQIYKISTEARIKYSIVKNANLDTFEASTLIRKIQVINRIKIKGNTTEFLRQRAYILDFLQNKSY